MKEHERGLYQDIEKCVDLLQEAVDIETKKAVSVFTERTCDNERWLDEVKRKYKLKDDDELEQIQFLKAQQSDKLSAIETKIEYFEKLCDELEEFQAELEVKTKLAQNRRSRLNSIIQD